MATSTCSSRRNCVGRKPLRAIPTFSARPSFAVLLLFALVGCATRYAGRVIDVQGRPVPYARVEGDGMRGGMITGEGPFTVCAIADADGHFRWSRRSGPKLSQPVPRIRNGRRCQFSVSKPPLLIAIRWSPNALKSFNCSDTFQILSFRAESRNL